jgi:hypothetical protein
MTNDYYDFNPSATTWVLMLSGMVLFVVALSLLLIYLVHRSGQATAPAKGGASARQAGEPLVAVPRDARPDASGGARVVTHGGHDTSAKAS